MPPNISLAKTYAKGTGKNTSFTDRGQGKKEKLWTNNAV